MNTPSSELTSSSSFPKEVVGLTEATPPVALLPEPSSSPKLGSHITAENFTTKDILNELRWSTADGGVLIGCPERLYQRENDSSWPFMEPVTDGKTYQQYFLSKLLVPRQKQICSSADGYSTPSAFDELPMEPPPVSIMGDQIVLRKVPTTVAFFVPGNPGVASAYLPWCYYLLSLLGNDALVVFSGHLGHLRTSNPTEAFTCAMNIEHQKSRMQLILDGFRTSGQSMPAHFVVMGHSAGGHFSHRGLWELWKSPASEASGLTEYIQHHGKFIFLCPTLVGFAAFGKLKAMIAASPSGLRLCLKVRQSKWWESRTSASRFHSYVTEEFSENFIYHMSSLTKDELECLPENLDHEIEICDAMGIPTFFLLAANDAYVRKDSQRQYLDHFGASKVYVSQDWWHAYCLHEQGFLESGLIIASIATHDCVPRERQLQMRRASNMRWDTIAFETRVGLARIICGALSVASGFQRLLAAPFQKAPISTS